ncbi:MAG: flagellar hook-associated protein FlgK [Calditrichaeota bacterium]|nr:MAG: flagellar hook-associated protein FlgK [Calditrichota bacterium]
MPGIFQTLDIARRAIWASRLGIDVTSHNIANVNTPGYSRQLVNFEAASPLQLLKGQLGLGVEADDIRRVRNQLLDLQYRQANQSLGKNQIKENTLYQVETILQEPAENSLGNLLNDFFSEFSNLATEPENMTIRNVLLQKAIALSDGFREKYNRLTETRDSLRSDIENVVNQVNNITREIADLNAKISVAESTMGSANDLRDRRDLLLDQLSEFVNIQYREDSEGQFVVTAGGQSLVTGHDYRELSVETDTETQKLTVTIKGPNDQPLQLRNGRLSGLVEMHNTTIPEIIDRLNTLAGKLIEEVNRVHKFGKGLPVGQPPQSATGLNFFTGSDAASINVSPEIVDNVANIAASIDGSPGNSDVALTIANLRNRKVFNSNAETLTDYYNTTITNLGTDIEVARTNRVNQEKLKDQIQNQRNAESGVSLDEEMTQLIKYQRTMEASARIVRVVDEILNTVINMI